MKYKSGAAFRQALETRLIHESRQGISLVRLRKIVAFERFLARLVAAESKHWSLKGRLELELRLGEKAHTTKGIDLVLSSMIVSLPGEIKGVIGEEIDINVNVMNLGSEALDRAFLQIYTRDANLPTLAIPLVESGRTEETVFTFVPTKVDRFTLYLHLEDKGRGDYRQILISIEEESASTGLIVALQQLPASKMILCSIIAVFVLEAVGYMIYQRVRS